MIKKALKVGLLGAAVLGLTACSDVIEVPPAHVAKISTKSGLENRIIPPSKVKLEAFCITCDSLIIAEASDKSVKETLNVFMPKDELNLTVEVRATVSVSNDKANIEQIFSRIPPQQTQNSRVRYIALQSVYDTYAQPIFRETVRSFLTQYTIEEVMNNRDSISAQLTDIINSSLKETPIKLVRFGLADIQPPKVIVDAQESAKKREIQIKEAEANKMVALKEAEAALEVAIKQQQVDLKEAETQVLVNKRMTEGVNQAFIAQRSLKVLEKLAESDNHVILLPMEALQNPAIMVGINQKALSYDKK